MTSKKKKGKKHANKWLFRKENVFKEMIIKQEK